jgi:hypothetical protein
MKATYIIQGLDTEGCWSSQYISQCRRGTYDSLIKVEQARRIDPGRKPHVIEIRIVGKLAEIRKGYDAALFRRLRRAGVVGAFTRASMGTNPELVLWEPRAIKSAREIEW